MVVTCISNTSRDSAKLYEAVGYSEKSGFQVTIGREYVVHAMALLGLHLVLLLQDDSGQPEWFPASQFKVANPHLAGDWAYDIRRRDGRGLQAIWGYAAMVVDRSHNEGLIAREAEALRVFAEATERMPLEAALAL